MTRDNIKTLHQLLKRVDGLMLENAQHQLIHEIAGELHRVLEVVIAELDHRANLRLRAVGRSRGADRAL
jgi:hypothetical protein